MAVAAAIRFYRIGMTFLDAEKKAIKEYDKRLTAYVMKPAYYIDQHAAAFKYHLNVCKNVNMTQYDTMYAIYKAYERNVSNKENRVTIIKLTREARQQFLKMITDG